MVMSGPQLNQYAIVVMYLLSGGVVGGASSFTVSYNQMIAVERLSTEIKELKHKIRNIDGTDRALIVEHGVLRREIERIKDSCTECKADIKMLDYILRGYSSNETK